jgi:hypothetical protein
MNKTTINTCDAIGPALDWLVASIEQSSSYPSIWAQANLAYSTDWRLGGQIIDRERMNFQDLFTLETPEYQACIGTAYPYSFGYGSTHLIAAMRCYVASKLGDTVEVPSELLRT